jgi:hypothetical protein
MRFTARSTRSCSSPASWIAPPWLVVAILGTVGQIGTVGCQAAPASAGLDAGSGAFDGGDVASMSTCPPSTGSVDPTALIDNFEHGSSTLLPFIAGRVGGWYALGDGTASALLQPSGPVSPEVIPGGHCGSRYALHLTGAGFLDWGAQVITPLSYGPGDAGVSGFLPYDVSQYHGVMFSARLGDTSSAEVRFAIGDVRSRPEGGMCTLGGTFGNGCYDNFGVDLAPFLGVEWREFHIPFAGLGQRNIGLHADALETSRVYDLEFDFAPSVIFDLWVDDISFY